jgi:hypothetical protein
VVADQHAQQGIAQGAVEVIPRTRHLLEGAEQLPAQLLVAARGALDHLK